MKEKDIPFLSPKNKYHARIYFNKSLKNVGSCSSIGAMSLAELRQLVLSCKEHLIVAGDGARVVVLENKKKYPEFNFVEIEKYEIDVNLKEFGRKNIETEACS